jgi:hypothetical protein
MRVRRFLRRRYPVLFEFLTILFIQGPRGYFDYVRNSNLVWSSASRINDAPGSVSSSISDGTAYVEVCKRAVEEAAVFDKFKSSLEYRGILEHCDYLQGRSYLKLIKKNQEIKSNLERIAKVDNGKPFTFYYNKLGQVSPSQIRYAKVLQDLEFFFGSLSDLRIAEIGVGYGGQAIHILSRHSPKNYCAYDLEWPAKLMLKNVQQCGVDLKILPEIKSWKDSSSFDLVISNYAFSELFREVQEIYLENVVLNSKAGYMIYNHIHEKESQSMSATEFASRIPGAAIYREIPETFPGNVLVVWGHKKGLDFSNFS